MSPHPHKTCPRCDHPLTGAESVCPGCRMALSGTRWVGGTEPPAVCPVCKLPLYEAVLAGLPVFHCAECRGMGLKREVLMKLQPFGPKKLEVGAEERGYRRPPYFEPRQKPPFLICPSCRKRMKEITLGKRKADLCGNCCTLWVDEPGMEHLNDMLAPYKWKASQDKR